MFKDKFNSCFCFCKLSINLPKFLSLKLLFSLENIRNKPKINKFNRMFRVKVYNLSDKPI